MTKQAVNLAQVQQWFGNALKREANAEVDTTRHGLNKWSLCGTSSDAAKAMEYIESRRLGRLDRVSHEGNVTIIDFTTGA